MSLCIWIDCTFRQNWRADNVLIVESVFIGKGKVHVGISLSIKTPRSVNVLFESKLPWKSYRFTAIFELTNLDTFVFWHLRKHLCTRIRTCLLLENPLFPFWKMEFLSREFFSGGEHTYNLRFNKAYKAYGDARYLLNVFLSNLKGVKV